MFFLTLPPGLSGISILYRSSKLKPQLELLVNHVRHSIRQAYIKLSNLKSQSIRQKRVLFNFVGRVQGWLFGTLTGGERYDKTIATLDKNQQSMYHGFSNFVSKSKPTTEINENQVNENDVFTSFSIFEGRMIVPETAVWLFKIIKSQLDHVLLFS